MFLFGGRSTEVGGRLKKKGFPDRRLITGIELRPEYEGK